MAEKKGRWITTKNGRHIFIPEGKDVGEVLKEKFGDDNDSEDTEFDYNKYDTDQEKEFEEDDWSKLATETDKKVPKNWESDGWDGDTRFYSVNDQKGVRSVSVRPDGQTIIYTEKGSVSFESLDEAKEFMNLKTKQEAEDYLWDKNGYISETNEDAYDDMFNEFDERMEEDYDDLERKITDAEDMDEVKSLIENSSFSWDEKEELAKKYGVKIDNPNKFGKNDKEEFNEDTSDYEPDWDENKDRHYQAYNEKVKNAKYDENEINKILRIADDYSKEADQGFITYDQMDRYAEKMGLKDLSDKELRQAWDKYYNILSRQAFKGGSMNNYRKFGDAASAFAEIINREARSRKEKGNYFPYDDNDVNEAKNKINSIAKKHEGYDMDSSEAYLTSDEANQIKQIANEYHITDEDLEKLSNLFNRKWGYTGYGYKKR